MASTDCSSTLQARTQHVAKARLGIQVLLLLLRVGGDAHIIALGQHDVGNIEVAKREAVGLPLKELLLLRSQADGSHRGASQAHRQWCWLCVLKLEAGSTEQQW